MLIRILTYNIRGLPWCKCPIEEIASWAGRSQVPILCFQEVFTAKHRAKLKQILERFHYTVLIPHDEDVCFLPSGLVTAVHTRRYSILSTCFISFLTYYNVEAFANKGFQTVWLQDRNSGQRVHIANTHTQSDEEVGWISTTAFRKHIRYQQAQQIIHHYDQGIRDPVLVVGDFNQESSLHPYLRTLHPPSSLPLKKATFFRTGEDLDHIAWMPVQWSAAIGGCGFCGNYGPALQYCKVHQVALSDHAPVEMHVRLHEGAFRPTS
jgi:endonuclease/exonuclease/phosphatase family metal-dependent hydrolase